MLLEIAGALVASGILLLIIGIFIARQYTLRAKLVTAFMVIVLTSLAVLAVLDGYIMGRNLTDGANKSLSLAARNYADRIDRFLLVRQPLLRQAADVGGCRELSLGEPVGAIVLDEIEHIEPPPYRVAELAEPDRCRVAGRLGGAHRA